MATDAYSSNDYKEKKKKKIYMPIDVLLLGIFIRLPASSLQRFKTANKLWFRGISDPHFVEAHLAHQSRLECRRFILRDWHTHLLIETSKTPRHLEKPGPAAHGPILVHGSCKGLVLFHCRCFTCKPLIVECEIINNISMHLGKFPKLHVANPVTGETIRLPPFREHCGPLITATIGCDRREKIKVVIIAKSWEPRSTSTKACLVLTLGDNAWRKVNIPINFQHRRRPILQGGALHWLYDTGVLTMDLAQEKFHKTEVNFIHPTVLKSVSAAIEWDGCLAVVSLLRNRKQDLLYRVWVLRDSGWMKQPDLDIALFEHLCPSERFSNVAGPHCPYLLTTLGNGQTIMFWKIGEDNLNFLAYDVARGVMTPFAQLDKAYFGYKKGTGYTFIEHVDSLVSCKANSSAHAPGEEEAFDRSSWRREGIHVRSRFSSLLLSMVQNTVQRFNIFWYTLENLFGL